MESKRDYVADKEWLKKTKEPVLSEIEEMRTQISNLEQAIKTNYKKMDKWREQLKTDKGKYICLECDMISMAPISKRTEEVKHEGKPLEIRYTTYTCEICGSSEEKWTGD